MELIPITFLDNYGRKHNIQIRNAYLRYLISDETFLSVADNISVMSLRRFI